MLETNQIEARAATAPPEKKDTLGEMSLILSLVGIGIPVCTPAALIMGLVSWRQVGMNARNMLGLVISTLWMITLCILVFHFLPSILHVRQNYRVTNDATQLRRLGYALRYHERNLNVHNYMFLEEVMDDPELKLTLETNGLKPEFNAQFYLDRYALITLPKGFDGMRQGQQEAWLAEHTHFVICFGLPSAALMSQSRLSPSELVFAFSKVREGQDHIAVMYADLQVNIRPFDEARLEILKTTGKSYADWTSGVKIKRDLNIPFPNGLKVQFKPGL